MRTPIKCCFQQWRGFVHRCLIVAASMVAANTAAPDLQAQNAEPVQLAPVYDIYTANIPPYVRPAANGATVGTLVPAVEAYFNERQLPYKMNLLPWSAAYRRTMTKNSAIIFPIDRTPARENLFHWIKPLITSHYYVYGLREAVSADTSLDAIRGSDAIVSCPANAVQCELLLKNGFQEKNILRLEDLSVPQRFRLILNGRNAYSVFDPIVFESLMQRDGLDGTKLIRLGKVGEISGYLAANKSMPAPLLERLR